MTGDFFDATDTDDPLRADLMEMIHARDYVTPRHRQKELGPSDCAHPCMRRMAYATMLVERCNPQFDPLPSIIGVATHKWLESAAAHANMILGRQRWLAEMKVNVAPGLSGSCDLYDCDTETVIDWKVPGRTRFTKYRKDPGPIYRSQAMLYGRGFANAGRDVQRVAIAFLPRGGTLRGMHIWQARYDPDQADAILQRREATLCLINDLDVENQPERYRWFPTTPWDCEFCAFFNPNPTTPLQCGGA